MSADHETPINPSQRTKNVLLKFTIGALREIGLVSLWQSPLDSKLLCAQRFVRLFAYGGSTLILAAYLSALGISDDRIGLFMTLTLAGDVVISFILTLFADAMGRKAVLALGSALMCVSGLIFGFFDNYWVLLAAAVFGVISPSGNEIGPFRAVEESTIAHLTPKEELPDVFAWYSLIGTAGTALGLMLCGWILTVLQVSKGWDFIPACRIIFFVYAAVGLVKLAFTLGLSTQVESAKKQQKIKQQQQQQSSTQAGQQSSETEPLLSRPDNQTPSEEEQLREQADATKQKPRRKILFLQLPESEFTGLVINLCFLFALDAFASGLASMSWMTYFFRRKFSLPEGQLGSIFFTTSIVSAASMLVASSIAKRFGNVKTMVFTHLPSAICLSLIAIPSSLPLALTFLVLRASTQSMDVAPRSAFLAAALPPDQRTAIMGTINVVKTCSQSVGPLLTGVLAGRGYFYVSFVVAGILKAIYDIGMLLTFGGKESEERSKRRQEERQQNGDEEGRR